MTRNVSSFINNVSECVVTIISASLMIFIDMKSVSMKDRDENAGS